MVQHNRSLSSYNTLLSLCCFVYTYIWYYTPHTMQEKKELRNQMLDKRNAIDNAEKGMLDEHICTQLLQLISERKPAVVHCYIPMGSEIDIKPVISYMLEQGITVLAPKALKQRQMENLLLRSLDELESGIYGTQHPANSTAYMGDIDLFIIPGLAFDKNNYRLGYGSGYYDTFLHSQHNAYKVGICYPFQLIEKVPTEPHDEQLSTIIY
jgi:5-formyltetrahydrofolate cyclo-ligase